MAKILELSEQLANQIAAGEVVERPASVVKELVENAIDAGSTQIDILLEEAGLRKIQVIDNGEGIADEDIENAFKRHATSKIHHQSDLFRIRTLGFRGEALPSIASVSEMTIETAVSGAQQGSILTLHGGKVIKHQAAPLRQGTKITVENLFFNTPARLKYVKTLQTELANVGDIVNRLALSHPKIAFRLLHETNQLVQTTGTGDLKQTIAGIYGLQTAKKMRPIQAKDLDFQLTGYVSLPEVTRASRNYLSTIINGRYIKNYALNKAIIQGYGSKLMVGRFPIAILEVEMDPLLVDVNVHPTKQEVRLSKEAELVQLIKQAVFSGLKDETLIPNVGQQEDFKKKFTQVDPVEQLVMELPQQVDSSKKGSLAFDARTGEFYVPNLSTNSVDKTGNESSFQINEDQKLIGNTDTTEEYRQVETLDSGGIESSVVDNYVDNFGGKQRNETFSTEEIKNNKEGNIHPSMPVSNQLIEKMLAEEPSIERFPELEYFGQMHGTYLFAQGKDGLYIIDQHAAQERIKYEYYREKIGEVGNQLQDLLVPLVLEYPFDDYLKLKAAQTTLTEVGLILEEFGSGTFLVRAHPTWFPEGQEEQLIRELVDMFLQTGAVDIKKFREGTAIMMSCKRSIKANHYLNDEQARELLNELATCENPFNCPHGRPVLVHFTAGDMERMFKRIQDSHRSLRSE